MSKIGDSFVSRYKKLTKLAAKKVNAARETGDISLSFGESILNETP